MVDDVRVPGQGGSEEDQGGASQSLGSTVEHTSVIPADKSENPKNFSNISQGQEAVQSSSELTQADKKAFKQTKSDVSNEMGREYAEESKAAANEKALDKASISVAHAIGDEGSAILGGRVSDASGAKFVESREAGGGAQQTVSSEEEGGRVVPVDSSASESSSQAAIVAIPSSDAKVHGDDAGASGPKGPFSFGAFDFASFGPGGLWSLGSFNSDSVRAFKAFAESHGYGSDFFNGLGIGSGNFGLKGFIDSFGKYNHDGYDNLIITTPGGVSRTLTSGTDIFITGAGADTFTTSDANFSAADIITARAGRDTLIFTDAATITKAELANKTGIDVVQLGGNSTIALSDAFVNASDNNSVRINNSTYTVSLDTSALASGHTAVIGGTGAVTLTAGGTVHTAAGVNTNITMSSGVDTIVGNTGNDTVTVADANFASTDTLTMGAGTDTLVFSDAATITTAELANKTGVDVVQLGGNSTIALSDAFVDASDSNSVRINNSTYTVSLDTSALAAGHDAVIGGTGTVTLSAAGKVTSADGVNTTVVGSTGADTFVGGTGNDTFTGGYGGDTISGGAGNDTIYADNQAFTANTVSGLTLWLDAKDINGDGSALPSSNSDITTWIDKSSSGYDMTTIASRAPRFTYDSDGIPVVRFDSSGSGDSMSNTSASTIFGSTYSAFFHADVLSVTDTGIGGDGIFGVSKQTTVKGKITITTADRVGLGDDGQLVYRAFGEFPVDLTDGTTDYGASHGAFTLSMLADFEGNQLTPYVDGALQVIAPFDRVDGGVGFTFFLGAKGTGSSSPFDGLIYNFLTFDHLLNAADQATVEQFLAFASGNALASGGFGADTLTGGLGADTFVWSNASYSSGDASARDVITDFNSGSGSYDAAEGDLIDISTLVATPINAVGTGGFDSLVNQLSWAQSGSDTIVSIDYGGDNTADWSIKLSNFDANNLSYNDFTFAFNSFATQTGTSGDDTLTGDAAKINIIYGGAGNDTITGGANGDHLQGDAGNDTINGGAGNDIIYTTVNGGTDTVYGDSGADLLVFAYNDNNDVTYYGGTGSGGSGNDGIMLNNVGAHGGNWTLSSATSTTSSDQGGGVTRYTFDTADASGTLTMNDGSVITFAEVDYVDFS